jgi:hypothetical protein
MPMASILNASVMARTTHPTLLQSEYELIGGLNTNEANIETWLFNKQDDSWVKFKYGSTHEESKNETIRDINIDIAGNLMIKTDIFNFLIYKKTSK